MASRLPRSELLVVRLEGPLPSLATERRRPSVTLLSMSGIEIGGPSWIMDRILNFGGDTESTCSDSSQSQGILVSRVLLRTIPVWTPMFSTSAILAEVGIAAVMSIGTSRCLPLQAHCIFWAESHSHSWAIINIVLCWFLAQSVGRFENRLSCASLVRLGNLFDWCDPLPGGERGEHVRAGRGWTIKFMYDAYELETEATNLEQLVTEHD